MTCTERAELITALVAGGLEPREHRELRDHLEQGCARCATALAAARRLELALALSPEPIEPSPEAKRQLRERLAATQDERPASRQRAAAAAALSAIAAGAAVAAFLSWRADPIVAERDALRSELVEAEATRTLLAEEIAELRSELAVADQELMEIESDVRRLETGAFDLSRQLAMLSAESVVVVAIAGTRLQPDASARIFWGEDYYCYLRAENLRHLAPERTYALWLDTENHGVVLAGTFEPGAGGAATLWVPLDHDLGHIARAFVTAEALRGAGPEEPTGAVELESARPGAASS